MRQQIWNCFANAKACAWEGLQRGLKRRPRSSHPHQGGTCAVIKTMLAVAVRARATVEKSVLLNPCQFVSGIIEACIWLISLDCIRIKLRWAIWSVAPKGADSAVCRNGALQAVAPGGPLAVQAHQATPELLPPQSSSGGTPRVSCLWNRFQAPICSLSLPHLYGCSLHFYSLKQWCAMAVLIHYCRPGHLRAMNGSPASLLKQP